VLAVVTAMTVLRMIQRGDLKGQQLCKGAPWVIRAEDVAAFAAYKQSKRRACAAS